MKRVNPESITHESSNKLVTDLIKNVNVRYVVKLDDALAKRGVTQQWLAITTGLRQAAISDLVKGTKTSLNKLHPLVVRILPLLKWGRNYHLALANSISPLNTSPSYCYSFTNMI